MGSLPGCGEAPGLISEHLQSIALGALNYKQCINSRKLAKCSRSAALLHQDPETMIAVFISECIYKRNALYDCNVTSVNQLSQAKS